MIVDVIYDEDRIYHVLEPNSEGVRGVPLSQFMIRDTVENVKEYLAHLGQEMINNYILENGKE